MQELIAPRHAVIFDREWRVIGTKSRLRSVISTITSIKESVLATGILDGCTVQERMSWAAGRQTTRLEDIAYCLLGIFGINMPLLYGEGMAAFERLQQAILDQREDYSIFLWAPKGTLSSDEHLGLLSPTPANFTRHVHVMFSQYPEVTSTAGGTLDTVVLKRISLFENQDTVRALPDIFPNGISHLMSDPPQLTNRGLSVSFNAFTLKWRRSDDDPGAVFVWTFQMIRDRFLCLVLLPHRSNMGTVHTRHRDIRLVSKDVIEKAEMKRYFLSLRPIRRGRGEGRHELEMGEPALALSAILPSPSIMSWWDKITLEHLQPKEYRPHSVYQLDKSWTMMFKLPNVVPITPEARVTEIFQLSRQPDNTNIQKRYYAVITGLVGQGAWALVLEMRGAYGCIHLGSDRTVFTSWPPSDFRLVR